MSIRFSPKDRRRFQRLELNIAVFYRVHEPPQIKIMVGEQEIEATMINVSVGGMAMLTRYNIPIFSILLIKFGLFKMDKQGRIIPYGDVRVTGEVRNNILRDNSQYRLGIRFDKMERQHKVELGKFVQMALYP